MILFIANSYMFLHVVIYNGLLFLLHFFSVSGFEFTQELAIFDLLSVQLYHGWLVDPNDHTSYDVVAPYTYNQLVEYAINNASSEDSVIAQKGGYDCYALLKYGIC